MYLHQNGIVEDVPIVVLLKAMGVQSDREIFELVAAGNDEYGDAFSINLEECASMEIYTQQQALDWFGSKVRIPKRGNMQRGKPQDEAREFISDFILAHVPVINGDMKPKIMYIAIMARRVLMAAKDPKLVDDRDYVGNKRLELYSLSDILLTPGPVSYCHFFSKIFSNNSILNSKPESKKALKNKIVSPNSMP
jgi:DNA-directed RNA polymerase III subunit RPC2